MATWNLTTFSIALLQKIKAPTSLNNINLVNAWQLAEGGSGIGARQQTPTAYNPLNTVMPGFGGTPTPGYSAGIMSYPNFTSGVNATAAAITNTSAYSGILADLRASAPPSQTAATISAAPGWTTFSYGGTPPSTTTLQGGNIPKGGFPQKGGLIPVPGIDPYAGQPVPNPLNIPGDLAKAALSPVESAIGGWLKEAAIIGIGIILVFMGLWIMFRDHGNSTTVTAPSAPAPAKGSAEAAGGDELVDAAALA